MVCFNSYSFLCCTYMYIYMFICIYIYIYIHNCKYIYIYISHYPITHSHHIISHNRLNPYVVGKYHQYLPCLVDPQASPNRVPNRGFEVRNKQISVPRAIGFKANFGDGKERWKPPGSWGADKIYPLVMTIALERSTIFNGKNPLFQWPI